jgi:hypothetical protein
VGFAVSPLIGTAIPLAVPIENPLQNPYWLTLSVTFDIIIGFIPFLFLIILFPRIEQRANATMYAGVKTNTTTRSYWTFLIHGKIYDKNLPDKTELTFERHLPRHRHWWEFFMWMRAVCFILLVGVLGDLILSEGWANPFTMTPPSLNGIGWSMPGWFFDLFFARANGQPNGAHIISYIGIPVFGLIVAYKYRPPRMIGWFGDTFQGIIAAGFLGAVHELTWIILYYIAYAKYVSFAILPELIRDLSFVILLIFLIVTFWKFKGRKMPMSTFKWPILLYLAFDVAWFVVPWFFGYPVFPITTINNPQFGNGLYQETPWFGVAWVNVVEVASWVLLYASFIYVVARLKK